MNTDKANNNNSNNGNNAGGDNTSNQKHPANPFKEPVPDTNETPEEISEEEQKIKEALTERD